MPIKFQVDNQTDKAIAVTQNLAFCPSWEIRDIRFHMGS